MRWQEHGTTTPRTPTVAEARQRDKAQKARAAAERFAQVQRETVQKRAASGRRMLMGSVAVVGIVGAVALAYVNTNQPESVNAACVEDGTNRVVPDNYCTDGYSGSGGTLIYAGFPYRYYYGGNNRGVGTTATGGTLQLPKGTVGKTKTGTSISRGGFGSSSHGSSGS